MPVFWHLFQPAEQPRPIPDEDMTVFSRDFGQKIDE
jgi:hypothetical protein